MRVLIMMILACFSLMAKTIELKNFEVDLYSKNNSEMKKITMDLEILVPDNTNESALKDTINVIASSFYAQDLLSSRGKEAFKESIKKYALSKHKITVHSIFIIALKEVSLDIQKVVKLLEEHYKKKKLPQSAAPDDFGASTQDKNIQQKAQNQANRLIEEQMKASSKMLDNMKDFGDVEFYQGQ